MSFVLPKPLLTYTQIVSLHTLEPLVLEKYFLVPEFFHLFDVSETSYAAFTAALLLRWAESC